MPKADQNKIEKAKKGTKLMLAGVLLLLVLVGSAVAMYLMSTQQDPRQQASTPPASVQPDRINPTATPTPPTDPNFCAPIVLENRRAEWVNNNTQIKLQWTATNQNAKEYEIWNISYDDLDPANPSQYYLVNLTQDKPLPSTATSFIVSNPNQLKTRHFLIRGINRRDEKQAPICYDQYALCQPAMVTNRQVEKTSPVTYRFSWQPIHQPLQGYEIWMISQADLDPARPEKYYLKRLASEIPPASTTFTVTLDAEAQKINTNRFLLRYIDSSRDGKPLCFDEGALGVEAEVPPASGACTLSFVVTAPTGTLTPTVQPTPTLTPPPGATATPTPPIGCNDLCVTNADCVNQAHICWTVSETESRCRLDSNVEDSQCRQAGAPAQPGQPSLPDVLPETGPANWGNWLKAGLSILGIGAALLLML